MDKNRLEAFSDGVIAIIITIMVLELKAPENTGWEALWQNWPVFLTYAISFLFVGLYWSSHHHLFYLARKVNARILWVNMFGLFCLSFTPFATAWMGKSRFNSTTVTFYAIILTMSVISYLMLVYQLRSLHGFDSEFSMTFKGHLKSYMSIVLNLTAASISFFDGQDQPSRCWLQPPCCGSYLITDLRSIESNLPSLNSFCPIKKFSQNF